MKHKIDLTELELYSLSVVLRLAASHAAMVPDKRDQLRLAKHINRVRDIRALDGTGTYGFDFDRTPRTNGYVEVKS
jgi:hypothetical protein